MVKDLDEKYKQTMINSLHTGMQIVDVVSKANRPLKFNEIQELTDITKSNLYKYLNTLTYLNILHRDAVTGMYTIGTRLIDYGMSAVNQENVIERMMPQLQEINRYCKETVLLAVWAHKGPMVVRMLSSHYTLNIGAQTGTYLPLNSAAGKIFAAYLEPYRMQEWLDRHLGDPHLERERISDEIGQVRADKISFAQDALIGSISSMAIPVFNFNQSLACSVIIVGFTDRIPQKKEDQLSQYLLQKSAEMTALLGGTAGS